MAFKWTLLAYRAASILGCAIDLETAKKEAAEAVGKTVRTIENWQRDPSFADMVAEIRQEFAKRALAEVQEGSLADYATRIAKMDERYRKLEAIVQARAEADPIDDVPGHDTGLIQRRIHRKYDKDGNVLSETESEDIDTSLLGELRALEGAAHRQTMDVTGQAQAGPGYEFIAD